jgi:hypothetical protein
MPKPNTYYYAIAFRYGSSDHHWYVCGVHHNIHQIERIARYAHEQRGGKYAVAVYAWDATILDGLQPASAPTVQYFPSCRGEEKLEICGRCS